MKSDCQRILLLQPPYGDYTYPYHSLSYVSGVLGAAGYETDVADLNALWFRSVFADARLEEWTREISDELSALQARGSLDITQQDRLVSLVRALALARSIRAERAVAILRSEDFFDPELYGWARRQVRRFEELLNFLYPPFDFFTAFAIPPFEPSAAAIIGKARTMTRLIDDLSELIRHRFGANRYLFCGVTVPFSANLVPAMALMIAVARVFPGTLRLAGGTAISDAVKYARSGSALAPFGELCDFFYAGEAETALVMFAEWCRGEADERPRQAIALRDHEFGCTDPPYVALGSPDKANVFVPYDWRARPPDYGWIDWDLYLSPEKAVNYAPARGCFWNKCTFCDYGLNSDGPTAPARTMESDLAVEHMRQLAGVGIRHVYLAADALTPRFLAAFADELIERGIDLRWACQLFLTRSFDRDLVGRLGESGLQIASFGLESGSSRVLERMGKGRDRVEAVLRPAFDAFRSSRIGLQPVFFFGFPGETDEDRHLTVSLLRDNLDVVSTVGKGGVFSLLAGSIIARKPGEFGVRCEQPAKDDISGVLRYQLDDDADPPNCQAFGQFNDALPHSDAFERPWLGGVDTLHTQLYVRRHGRDIFHRLRRQEATRWTDSWLDIDLASPFDLDAVMQNVVIYRAMQRNTVAERVIDGAMESIDAAAGGVLVQIERAHIMEYSLKLRDSREP